LLRSLGQGLAAASQRPLKGTSGRLQPRLRSLGGAAARQVDHLLLCGKLLREHGRERTIWSKLVVKNQWGVVIIKRRPPASLLWSADGR